MFDQTSPADPKDGFDLMQFQAGGRVGLGAWIATPPDADPSLPPLVAVHGIRRGAQAQAAALVRFAAMSGRTVIAPHFTERQWPQYQQVVRKGRADMALLNLLQEIEIAGICQTSQFALSGYSGGAQFAHRFTMLYPHRVARLGLISAGWYTFPDPAPFPFGLAAPSKPLKGWRPRLLADMRAFLRTPIRVLIGELDDVVDDTTRSGPDIDQRQGQTRRERARRWVEAIRQAAADAGETADISLTELPGCGHDFIACVASPEARRPLLDLA